MLIRNDLRGVVEMYEIEAMSNNSPDKDLLTRKGLKGDRSQLEFITHADTLSCFGQVKFYFMFYGLCLFSCCARVFIVGFVLASIFL